MFLFTYSDPETGAQIQQTTEMHPPRAYDFEFAQYCMMILTVTEER